ncbi:hypothetical protein [Salipiger pallidus]|nr:hypothetical protein [Salipiger pallidus]
MHVRMYFDVALFVVMLVTGIAITFAAALGPAAQEAGQPELAAVLPGRG